jgi:hypothetical protein
LLANLWGFVLTLATAPLLGLLNRFKLFPKARVADTNPKIDCSPYPGSVFWIELGSEQCRISLSPLGRSASKRKIESACGFYQSLALPPPLIA